MPTGRVVGIWIASDGGKPMEAVDDVRAHAGRGLEGDRYLAKTGTYSDRPAPGRDVTLIENEAIEAIRQEDGIELLPGGTRRNIVTEGIALNHLVGRDFTVGGVRMKGVRLCEPCANLSKSAGLNLVTPLLHRAGLRAEIVNGGPIKVGDEIREA